MSADNYLLLRKNAQGRFVLTDESASCDEPSDIENPEWLVGSYVTHEGASRAAIRYLSDNIVEYGLRDMSFQGESKLVTPTTAAWISMTQPPAFTSEDEEFLVVAQPHDDPDRRFISVMNLKHGPSGDLWWYDFFGSRRAPLENPEPWEDWGGDLTITHWAPLPGLPPT